MYVLSVMGFVNTHPSFKTVRSGLVHKYCFEASKNISSKSVTAALFPLVPILIPATLQHRSSAVDCQVCNIKGLGLAGLHSY